MLTIYSKPNCPFCDRAKYHLATRNIQFNVVDIVENPDAREFLMTAGHRTVPQLYIGNELFVEGGYQGLAKLTDEELREKLCLHEQD